MDTMTKTPAPSLRAPRLFPGLCAVFGAALLAGCAGPREAIALRSPSLMERLTPYKLEIRQGNVVTQELWALVKVGMNREQVRDILGSPMLTDVFHADRWDYPYASARREGAAEVKRAVSVHFKGDAVDRLSAADLPTEQQFVSSMADRRSVPAKMPKLELSEEEKARLPAPVRTEAAGLQPPQGAARTYPPLEAR